MMPLVASGDPVDRIGSCEGSGRYRGCIGRDDNAARRRLGAAQQSMHCSGRSWEGRRVHTVPGSGRNRQLEDRRDRRREASRCRCADPVPPDPSCPRRSGEVVETPDPDEDRRNRGRAGPHRAGAGPRIAILSLREVRPIADFGGGDGAEEVLRDALAAGLYRVMVSSPRFTRGPLHRPVVAPGAQLSRWPARTGSSTTSARRTGGRPGCTGQGPAGCLRAGRPAGWYELGDQVIMHVSVVPSRTCAGTRAGRAASSAGGRAVSAAVRCHLSGTCGRSDYTPSE